MLREHWGRHLPSSLCEGPKQPSAMLQQQAGRKCSTRNICQYHRLAEKRAGGRTERSGRASSGRQVGRPTAHHGFSQAAVAHGALLVAAVVAAEARRLNEGARLLGRHVVHKRQVTSAIDRRDGIEARAAALAEVREISLGVIAQDQAPLRLEHRVREPEGHALLAWLDG